MIESMQVYHDGETRVLVVDYEDGYSYFLNFDNISDQQLHCLANDEFMQKYTLLQNIELSPIPKKKPEIWDVWEHDLGGQWVVTRGNTKDGSLTDDIELTYLKGHGPAHQGARRHCNIQQLHDSYEFVTSLLENQQEYYKNVG